MGMTPGAYPDGIRIWTSGEVAEVVGTNYDRIVSLRPRLEGAIRAVHPSGRWLYGVARSGLFVVDTRAWQRIATVNLPEGHYPDVIHPDPAGARIYTLNTVSRRITEGPDAGSWQVVGTAVAVIDSVSHKVRATMPISLEGTPAVDRGWAFRVATDPAGRRIYVTGQFRGYREKDQGLLLVIDRLTLKEAARIEIEKSAYWKYPPRGIGLAVHPSGSHVYVTNNSGGTISVVDARTQRVVKKIRL